MIARRRLPLLIGMLLAACTGDEPSAYRGAGLEAASLEVPDQVEVYRAALTGPLPMGDPSLSILVDTLLLPRGFGLAGGQLVSPELLTALRTASVVQGTCGVPVQKTRQPLECRAARAGYAVRLSEPYSLGRDSVQVHVVVEQYAVPGGPRAERLRFERAYHVVKRQGRWRAVREARLPQP